MAESWSWGSVTEDLTGGLKEFIRLCNRRFRDLQGKIASLVSLPVGGGTAGTLPVWDSAGTGLSDSWLSQTATRVITAKSLRHPFGLAATWVSEDGLSEFGVVKLTTGDVAEIMGAWHVASADGNLRPATDDTFDVGSSTKRVRVVYVSDTLALGDIPATAGAIRLSNNTAILFRNQANTQNVTGMSLSSGDVLAVGNTQAASLSFVTTGGGAWEVDGSGHFKTGTDDTFDLGTSARRVRALYLARDIEGGTGGFAHTIHGWYQDNVAASQTNVELVHAAGRWTAVRAGSVLGVVVHATEARTAGTLTVTVFKNTGLAGAAGSSIGLTAVLNGTDTSRKATTQAKDTDTFAAGDELYAVVTTDGSWTPTTSDIKVSLLVEC